jgi:hypothetical protein
MHFFNACIRAMALSILALSLAAAGVAGAQTALPRSTSSLVRVTLQDHHEVVAVTKHGRQHPIPAEVDLETRGEGSATATDKLQPTVYATVSFERIAACSCAKIVIRHQRFL